MAKIYHPEIFGLREKKYSWLEKHNISNTKWKDIKPQSEFYLFIPQDVKLLKQYQSYKRITEIFPVNSVGVVTSRDDFVIDFEKNHLERRIRMFIDENVDDSLLRKTYKIKDKKNWNLKEQREKLRKDENWKAYFQQILYRPFDVRNIYYNDILIERSRKEVMMNILSNNIAIITSRMTKGESFKHAQVTDKITEVICMSPKTSINGFVFPLYLFTKKEKSIGEYSQLMIFEPELRYKTKQPNISEDVFNKLKLFFKKEPKPEEIFYYIYVVLCINTYRTKYAEFLKIDFPRIPFTKDYKLFIKLGKLGKQLADLHLLKSKELEKPIVKFPATGDNKVTIRPKWDSEKVYINANQHFTKVKEEVWNYQIGGYQVCEKWLKDRRKKTPSLDEITTYCQIVTALSRTIEIQKRIDENYKGAEK